MPAKTLFFVEFYSGQGWTLAESEGMTKTKAMALFSRLVSEGYGVRLECWNPDSEYVYLTGV